MRFIKNLLSQVHIYLIWILLSIIFWAWIFTFVTDAPAPEKVVVFVEAPRVEYRLMSARLEENLPQGIRMIKVHPFTYAMFDEGQIAEADILIVRESGLEAMSEDLADMTLEGDIYYIEGRPVALKASGAASEYITYAPDEDCWLVFPARGAHLGDGAAEAVAEAIIAMR